MAVVNNPACAGSFNVIDQLFLNGANEFTKSSIKHFGGFCIEMFLLKGIKNKLQLIFSLG